ncbi:hypothetical protein L6472_12850 [Prevotella sp. E13-17]|uniref:hypothetical protein n=1 Tax=Prevotella sp. E13-17 TaxID=2913616 RepID=UPI001EDC1E55|nr:hypothetical protein [Prevotella sp. E13-17]UKK50881.1 hypothetical protein L6472_12850 [Prevotella sp. E13-17]
MNKKIWSLLAILMVAVLSFGVASCSDDDEEEQPSSYYLFYEVTDQGNLSDDEVDALEKTIDDIIDGGDEFENMKLSTVSQIVEGLIKTNAADINEAFAGKSFTVSFFIDDVKLEKTVKVIKLVCVDGKVQ